jgi:PAS domain S-box-containing protein
LTNITIGSVLATSSNLSGLASFCACLASPSSLERTRNASERAQHHSRFSFRREARVWYSRDPGTKDHARPRKFCERLEVGLELERFPVVTDGKKAWDSEDKYLYHKEGETACCCKKYAYAIAGLGAISGCIILAMALAAYESQSNYPASIVDSIPALIHTARPDGYLDYFNQLWLRYVGLSLEDLLGWKWTTAIHPNDVELIVDKWRLSITSGEPFLHEARVRRADGEYRWMLHHKVAARDESGQIVKWHGSSIDIEDRKRAEDKIREQEAWLRQILDLAPQHIAVLGSDGSPLYSNRVGLEYFGINIDQWRETVSRLTRVHTDDREHFLSEGKKRLLKGEPHEFEARMQRHDGEFRHFLFRRNPLKDERGSVTRWYVTATDIEDRKQAEDRLRHENVALREEIDKTSMFEEIVGTSPALNMVLSRISKVASSDATVLITGETGTGKELVARAIHRRSDRASRAFVSVNCAAIPRDLIASELFGHEKGAFTGATQQRLGRFELANGGTIFLDEIGALPAETQIALLRVLQEHEFERVGGTRQICVDVRVIAATNRDLQAAIREGSFRSDLFYRLNVFPVEIPPLRARKEDIPLLVEYFIDRYARKPGKNITRVDKKTLELLRSYSWPGNIRELQNVIERSVILCEAETFSIDRSWLREPLLTEPKSQISRRRVDEEKSMIEAALKQSHGRVFGPTGAAARLGIPRSTLESKIRSLKIDKNRFKTQPGA